MSMGYHRILTIQDISCVGQCSMTVARPVLSACGHETCVLPSALLSTHTGGFGTPKIVHFSDALGEIAAHWQKTGITFDAILTGYLGSVSAVRTAGQIMDTLLAPGGKRIVDPAMADHGKLYSGFDDAYVQAMSALCQKADVILPNLTEAAILSGKPFEERTDETYACQLLEGISVPNVILTGVGETGCGFLLRENGTCRTYSHPRIPGSFSGTGDLFAAVFTGAWTAGRELYNSAVIAADFTRKCIERTAAAPAHWYGIQFEPFLPELAALVGENHG